MSHVPGSDGPQRTRGQRVLTSVEIESGIQHVIDRSEEVLNDLVALAEEDARTKHAYELARASENLEAGLKPGNGRDGRTTVDEREAMVMKATEEKYLAHLIAKARYESAKATLRVLENRMDGLRTVAANIRAQS